MPEKQSEKCRRCGRQITATVSKIKGLCTRCDNMRKRRRMFSNAELCAIINLENKPKDIAQELGCSVATVYTYRWRYNI